MIFFRSRYGVSSSLGHALKKNRFFRDEWSDIGIYTPEDDSRDIVWKKTTTENTYVKKRDSESLIKLIFASVSDPGEDFWTVTHPISREEWRQKSQKMLEFSAIRGGYGFVGMNGTFESILDILITQHTKNHLIILLGNLDTSSLQSLHPLMMTNDIVVIHTYHPWELHPSTDIMLEGRVFDPQKEQRYQQARKNDEYAKRKMLSHMGGSLLFTSTQEPIEPLLNHFFKFRYAQH